MIFTAIAPPKKISMTSPLNSMPFPITAIIILESGCHPSNLTSVVIIPRSNKCSIYVLAVPGVVGISQACSLILLSLVMTITRQNNLVKYGNLGPCVMLTS